MKTTQNIKLLNHLRKADSITLREALMEYNISSPSKRISELKQEGYNIMAFWRKNPATGQRYKRYKLIEEV